MDLLDHLDPKDNVAFLDRKVLKEILVLLDNLVKPVLEGWQVSLVPKDSVVNMELEENLVSWVHLGDLVPQVHLVTLVKLVHLALMAIPASKEHLEILVALVCLVHLANLELLDLKVLREKLDLWVALVKQANLDLWDHLENVDYQAYLVPQVPQVYVERLVHGENLVWKENAVLKVQLVLQVCLVLLVLLVQLVTLVLLVLMVNLVHLVFLVALVIKDLQVPQVHMDLLDHLVFLDHQDLLVPLALPESVVTVVKLGPRVWKVLLDPVASLVHQVDKVKKVRLELVVLKVPKDIVVSLVFRVFLVLWVQVEIRVYLVLLVPLVLLENLVLKVLLVAMEELVYKVLWVPQVLVVKVVMKEAPVLLVPLVLLVLLDHLVNRWAMMLQHWQLCLAKVNPKVQILFREMILTCPHVYLERKLQMTSVELLSQRPMNNSKRHSRSSSNQKAQKTLLQRPAKTLHMLIQSCLVVSTGLILMKVTPRMPL